MYRKTMTYTDLNGEKVTDELYFNISKKDAVHLMGRYTNGTLDEKDLSKMLDNLVKSNNTIKMVDFIEDIILSSYGEKSEDGRYFIKNKITREKFENSVAYAELFEELFTNQEELNKFVSCILPDFNSEPTGKTTASVVS